MHELVKEHGQYNSEKAWGAGGGRARVREGDWVTQDQCIAGILREGGGEAEGLTQGTRQPWPDFYSFTSIF